MAVVSKATMILGLCGIGVAIWLDWMVLERANATVQVPVAAQTIPPYTTITSSDITWKSIPRSAVPSDLVTNPVGRLTVLGVAAGDPIESSELASQGSLQAYAASQNDVLVPVNVSPSPITEAVTPGATVTLVANGVVYHDVLVVATNGSNAGALRSITNPNNQNTNTWVIMVPWQEGKVLLDQTAQVVLGNVPQSAITTDLLPDGTTTVIQGSTPTTNTSTASGTLAQPPANYGNTETLPEVQPGQHVTIPANGGTTHASKR
ncbi:MAG: SAF domain-containing protein [Alicyclobacillus mali]|uniref:SAF domain-containing protein n=1 Tax=Alicyclobacillus mali (ex Roth et al. 2021) TaxID=1123961 RepID=UPI0023F0D299|nr:SAF domain-containing protein [Alicyclobacillus mali (ex Roth et al. 2021)]MCL6488419.1 SAF domain-containing protein [Alicyclobacillus mali (ex Roth et al. 2021)]